MAKETSFKGKIVYTCMSCGWLYRDKDIAEKCEKWCATYKTCNLDLQRHAIKIK